MVSKYSQNKKGNTTIDSFFVGRNAVRSAPKKRSTVGGGIGAFTAFVVSTLLLGIVLSIVPVGVLSVGLVAANEGVDVWKSYPDKLDDVSIAERNVMYDINGDVFAEVWTEDRIPVNSLDDISKYAVQGLVDTEDKRFYENSGFDPKGTARSALSGSGGGSGITQQLVKNLQFYNLAGKDKKEAAVAHSYGRKVGELKLAMAYEKEHSKKDILLQYFNTVAFGSPTTYSIENASKYFFGKSAKDLDLAESAALVGSVNNPALFNMNDKKKEKEWKYRQKVVLNRMVAEGHITQEQAEKAEKQKLNLVLKKDSYGNCSSSKYPYYCQYVLKTLSKSEKLGETQEERDAILAKGGLQIKTYMDPKVMDSIQKELSSSFGNDYRIVAPTSVVEPGTGAVLGFGFNREYGEGKGKTTLNLADTPAAVGSTYKPFVLATALENGRTESSLKFGSPCPYFPKGYDSPPNGFKNSHGCGGYQSGVLDYKEATAWSSNTWYLKLAAETGIKNIKNMSKSLGLSAPDNISDRSISYAIGSVENTPINMSAAYATFANEGIYCPATPIKSYEYSDGTTPVVPDTYDPASDSCHRAMSPHTASVVLKSLRANTYAGEVKGSFGTKAQIKGYDAVGKSGTNEHYSYSWGQVSHDYGIFTNIYDMNKLTNGVYNNTRWHGYIYPGNVAPEASSDVLRRIVKGKKSTPLDYNNKDTSLKPVPVEKRDFFTIPSVIGMSPAEAVKTMESVGIETHVSKDKVKPPSASYPSGVIAEQSLEAGTQLPIGTKKDIVLNVTE